MARTPDDAHDLFSSDPEPPPLDKALSVDKPQPLDKLSPAYPARAAWGTATSLRAWQSEAIGKYFATDPRDFLAVATPGADVSRRRRG